MDTRFGRLLLVLTVQGIVACLTFCQARAQLVWDIKFVSPPFLGPGDTAAHYSFTSLAQSGDWCTIAYNREIFSIGQFINFMRSNDGGKTWINQDPGLRGIVDNFFVLDQADSLNVVTANNKGVILKTSDAGSSWHRADIGDKRRVLSLHFSDAMTGMAVTSDTVAYTYMTSDGGSSWYCQDSNTWARNVHSYGGGKFRAMDWKHGPVYTTLDGWKTQHVSPKLFDTLTPLTRDLFIDRASFGADDFILATGNSSLDGRYHGVITRSTDGGEHWDPPVIFDTINGEILCNTSVDRDTILVAGPPLYTFMSTDRGKTWRADRILLDSGSNVLPVSGIGLAEDGEAVACFGNSVLGPGFIARTKLVRAKVATFEAVIHQTQIYPNPASGIVTIHTVEGRKPIHIFDVLGREIRTGMLSDRGEFTIETSTLPRGAYSVVIEYEGYRVTIGKIAVIN